MPSFFSELQKDPTYSSLPDRIDEELLEQRVIALRQGDMTKVNEISVQLMRFVMSLVANRAHKRRTPDLIGVALLTLVETVKQAATSLEDNNILPYVSFTITRRLRDYITGDQTVRIPPRTLRFKFKKGEVLKLPSAVYSSADAPSNDEENAFFKPAIARPEEPSIECLEMLKKIVHNDREQLIIEMRAQRYELKEIAEKIGIGKSRVAQIKDELKVRFNQLNNK